MAGAPAPFGAAPIASNQMATASVVCGGISAASLICCCIPILNMFASIVVPAVGVGALVTGYLGYQESQKSGVGKQQAIAGMVLGGVGLGVALLMLFSMATFYAWSLANASHTSY